MAQDVLATLIATMEVWRGALTAPAMRLAVLWALGWLLTPGTHAVTQALVSAGVAGRRHHEAFHRFFSRGTWSPDTVGLLLLARIVAVLVSEDEPLRLAIDDTLAKKKGAHVFGLGNHVDPVRSTKAMRVFAFGHVWVVCAVLVKVPFSSRWWALPVLLRLYRNKKQFATKDGAAAEKKPSQKKRGRAADRKQPTAKSAYKRKTDLAREMIDVLVALFPGRRIEVSMDSAYCNDTVLRGLPENVVIFGAMRPDAVLCEPPKQTGPRPGRPAKRGAPLPKPERLAQDPRAPWRRVKATIYGKEQQVHVKTLKARWYVACRERLLQIVVVRVDSGRIAIRVFFSTDPSLDAADVLARYARRWAIECTFKDMKQHLGFEDSSARKQAAVERVAPMVGFLYSALVLWFSQGVHELAIARPPLRPWYSRKRDATFVDILQTAQRATGARGVFDPGCDYDNLQKLIAESRAPADSAAQRPPSAPQRVA